jgi:hypothetical protein
MLRRVVVRVFLCASCFLIPWIPSFDTEHSILPEPLRVQQTWASSHPAPVQAVASVPLRGIVSLQCDDGGLNNLALAESLAVRHLPCSFAVVGSWAATGHPTYLNKSDLLHVASLGHVILDHSSNHNTQIGTMSDADKDAEIRNSRNTLRSWGLDPKGWVAPGGAGYANFWCLLRETLAKYYPFAVMNNGWNNANPSIGIDSVDAYRIGSYDPVPDLGWSVSKVKAELATRLGINEWVILKFHTTPDTVVTKILDVVDWLVANEVPIVRADDAAALWFYDNFDLPANVFVDNGFTRDIDSNGVPDNCVWPGAPNYFVTDGRFGRDPLGGSSYLVVKSYACQFRLAGVSRGSSYSASFWAKALSPSGAIVGCRIYQEKHAQIEANSGAWNQINFTLPDTSWHMVDSLVSDGCNFVANDSTEILRVVFFSYSIGDSGVCLARPCIRLTSGRSQMPSDDLQLRCWPNPTTKSLTLQYYLPQEANVHLAIFDILGRAVSTLQKGHNASGPHVVVWDTMGDSARKVAPGVYFCCLETAGLRQTRKVLVLR